MKRSTKKIALALSAIMYLQPVMYAVDGQLNKEIIALEMELTKMKTHIGEYSDMSEAELNKKIEKTQKKIDKKKKKLKKEAEKDKERIKEGAKATGKELKEAGKELKDAGKEIGDTFKDLFN